MKACPDLHSTGSPPWRRTMSSVFQVRRGSCTMRAPGSLREEALGQQAHEVVPLDEPPALVEEEAAVVVPVPGQSHVRAAAAHRLGGGGAILLQHGVGHAVGECAVGLDG